MTDSGETNPLTTEDQDFDNKLRSAKTMGQEVFEAQARGKVRQAPNRFCKMATIPNTCYSDSQ